ncbi:hypothetical protein HY405_00735 [Candidatus Microgenomates bacterium]|nr:hypothetical protein [Candidatus Microgenomates bacterium]
MRKEVLIAIILGAALGLAIAFGVWRANIALSPKKTTQETTSTATPTSTPSSTPEFSLVVTQPEDEALVDTQTITVEGKTLPGATVIITSPADEQIVLAGSDGTFTREIKLESGANTVLITTINENDETVEQQITVTYSTEFKKQ